MLCDRILLIDQGRLVEERMIDALKDELRQHAATFLGDVALDGLASSVRPVAGGVWQAVFDDKDALLAGLGRIHGAGATLVDVVAQEGSLEDYFVRTVGRAA